MTQLVSARFSKQKVPGSILGDVNFCFDFRLIREAVVLNTRKRSTDSTDRGRVRKGGGCKGCTVGFH